MAQRGMYAIMQLSNIKMFLLQSDHGIRLTLATEIGMEREDSHHTSLLIYCPAMSGYDKFCSALAPYDDKHIYGIREQTITSSWCTRADILDSSATLFIFRDFETALLVQCQS